MHINIPLDLWAMTHISKWEEFRMGITPFKTDEWRVSNKVPDSDVVQTLFRYGSPTKGGHHRIESYISTFISCIGNCKDTVI